MITLHIANSRTAGMVGDLSAMTEAERSFAGAAATRMVWFAKDDDVLVLPWRPKEDTFIDYVTSLTKTLPSSLRFVSPPPGRFGADILSPDRLADEVFRAELRTALTDRTVGEVSPIYHDTAVAALVRALGVDGALPGIAFSEQGGTELINSKAVFRAVAAGVGAPTAPGAVVTSKGDAVDAIDALLTAGTSVILKQDHQAGGLGNEVVSRVEGVRPIGARQVVLAVDRRAVEEYIARRWDWLTGGRLNPVVIEHYYPESIPLFIEYLVTDQGIDLLGYGEMLMSPVLAGVVSPAPSLSPDELVELDGLARRICEPFRVMGYRGVLTPDAFLTPEGELLFSETNARISGATHLYKAVAESLDGATRLGDRAFLERGKWQVPSFGAAVDRLEAAGLAFDPATKTGVVLVCDMTSVDGTVRHCVVAEDLEHAYEMERRLTSLSASARA